MTTMVAREITKVEGEIASLRSLLDAREWAVTPAVARRTSTALRKAEARLAALNGKPYDYEPTTPPRDWYCGVISKAATTEMVTHRQRGRWGGYDTYTWKARETAKETWPHKAFEWDRNNNATDVHMFTAPVPADAMAAYHVAVAEFGVHNVRVYSPNMEDFAPAPKPRPIDPVIIAKAADGTYYEIARWAISEDIAAALAKM